MMMLAGDRHCYWCSELQRTGFACKFLQLSPKMPKFKMINLPMCRCIGQDIDFAFVYLLVWDESNSKTFGIWDNFHILQSINLV